MILSETVNVKISNRNFKHYKERGYKFNHAGDEIKVKVEDLPRGSNVKIKVLCDFCKETIYDIGHREYQNKIEKFGDYACSKCRSVHFKIIFMEKYGVDSPSKLKEVRKRMEKTSLERYGVPNPSQSSKIREKVNATLCANGTQKTSKQQLYLHNLYGGKINFQIKFYAVDICFPEEKIVIEYDGGGHDLRVVLGILTQDEFNQKEIVRGKIIKNEGYKTIRIKSVKDFLPIDDILLQMLSTAREYFNNGNHSWMIFDIDNSVMINAENKDIGGAFFDYGKLRKIKEVV